MRASDFIDHAQELAEDGRPAWCRSAVSRAYYGAHHTAVAFLYQLGVRTPEDGTGHVAAYNALISVAAEDEAVSEAGGDLMTLHGKRRVADYRLLNLSLERQEEALDLVQSAREIVEVLQECLEDEDRTDLLWQHFRAWVPSNGARLGLTLV